MNDFIDIYCERIGPGFWAEPLNALSNFSFFIAAFFAFKLARQNNALNRGSIILIFLLAVIGLGSFSFHTFATQKAQLADVIPILFYQIAFLLLYSARVMKVAPHATRSLMIMFALAIVAAHQIPTDVLNGSVAYLPALFFLGRFAAWHRAHTAEEKDILWLAAGLFTLSLTFRSLDMAFCNDIPLGLHFLWHILNGYVLYLTIRAYIISAKH